MGMEVNESVTGISLPRPSHFSPKERADFAVPRLPEEADTAGLREGARYRITVNATSEILVPERCASITTAQIVPSVDSRSERSMERLLQD